MSSQGSLCEACLSRDRTLFSLKEAPKYLIQELKIRGRVCWECRAEIINMVKFKRKVNEAQRRVMYSKAHLETLKSLSSLSIKVLAPVSVGTVDPQAMADRNMVESEVEYPKFVQIKQEDSPDIKIKQENDCEVFEEVFEAELEQFYQPEIPALLSPRERNSIPFDDHTIERNSIPINDHTIERDSLCYNQTSKQNYRKKGNMKRKRKRNKAVRSHNKISVVSKTLQKIKSSLSVSRDITNKPYINKMSELTSKRQSNDNISDTLANEFDLEDDIENNLIKTFKISKVDGSDSPSVKTCDPISGSQVTQTRFLPFLLSAPSLPSFSVYNLQSPVDIKNARADATSDILCPKLTSKAKQKILAGPDLCPNPPSAYSYVPIAPKPQAPPKAVALPPPKAVVLLPTKVVALPPPPPAEPVTTRSGRKVRSKDILNL